MSKSKFFVDPLYGHMADDLQLGGMSQRTYQGYLRAVRQLANCRTSSDKISSVATFSTSRTKVRLRVPACRLLRHQVLLYPDVQAILGHAGHRAS